MRNPSRALALPALLASIVVMAPANDPASAPQAEFVTSDIVHFWQAYDSGGKAGDTTAFRRLYLDQASQGLKDFAASRQVTPQTLALMVTRLPRYFAAIRASNLRYAASDGVVAAVRRSFQKIKELYPAAVFPPVTFLVGRFSSAGTTSDNGLLIGTEFYSLSAETPVDELPPFQRSNVHAIDSVAVIIAHEHAHILQDHARGISTHNHTTLLEQALIEGGADFIGELASGGNINARAKEFGVAHEAAIWADFKTAMQGTDVGRWLYNQGSATPERPGDLGYFVGYRIAEAYYRSHADKRAALADIIEIKDAAQFLAKSGYDPK